MKKKQDEAKKWKATKWKIRNTIEFDAELEAMAASPEDGERRRGKRLRLEKDIFGDEYLGARRILRLSMDETRLPEGALRLIEALQLMQKEESDLSRAFADALEAVEPKFWKKKLDELTPLEWKLLRALEDDAFREQVKDILG